LWYKRPELTQFEFADADAFIHIHPPHHHQDGPFLNLQVGRLRPCLRLQAGNVESYGELWMGPMANKIIAC